MKTCVFIAIVVVGLSGGRLSDEKGCCLSSKTREKNVCRGRMIELSTEMARVAEVHWRLTVEFCGMKRIIDRKCLNHARVHANVQSFYRCEGGAMIWDNFSIFRTNCSIACGTRAYIVARIFADVAQGNGVRNSRNRLCKFGHTNSVSAHNSRPL